GTLRNAHKSPGNRYSGLVRHNSGGSLLVTGHDGRFTRVSHLGAHVGRTWTGCRLLAKKRIPDITRGARIPDIARDARTHRLSAARSLPAMGDRPRPGCRFARRVAAQRPASRCSDPPAILHY